MNGLCITNAVKQFGITSKTLRYYERVGLLETKRADNNYRYYDESEVERIKQIMILRKMQISIRDIIRIYENEDMSTVVEVFVSRINAINDEISALSELKRITNEFLQVMLQNGVTKISTLPILYEQMEKHVVDYAELSSLSDRIAKSIEPVILHLQPMRVLSSVCKDGISNPDGFWQWVQTKNIPQGEPGQHERFEFQTSEGDVLVLKVSEDFINDGGYSDYIFAGGLFAAVNVYLDEDLGACLRSIIKVFDDNKYYQIDYLSDGNLRHAAMLENLISPDAQRELVALLVPVKKRLADPALFDKSNEVTDISIAEIEAANPVLWTADVPFGTLKPINNPQYKILESGELEYTGWISTRVLSTEVNVKLPFRVDIEFRAGEYKGFGANDESVRLYCGYHGLDHNYGFSVNMADDEAIRFYQPIFRDEYAFAGRGKITKEGYNHLTWIVGEKYLACIINGEVRYCGANFPYMTADLSREEARPIVFGTERTKYFRSIRVSQLVEMQKNKLKKGELIMSTRQSNNIIPNIHRLITDEYGENYWFNGCAKYVMESQNEPDYNYEFFAGLTGDVFTQFYAPNFRGDSATEYWIHPELIEGIFETCGYAGSFIPEKQLLANREMHLQTLMAYIDKGIPVIRYQWEWAVFVGYEEYGKTLLYITGNNAKPKRVSLEEALPKDGFNDDKREKTCGWFFIGEKKEQKDLAQLYRNAINNLPTLLTTKTDEYCFGAEAFRAWAGEIESGRLAGVKIDDMKANKFKKWQMYTNYICNMATNGSCCHGFLKRAMELNPDMQYLEEVSRLYKKTAEMWNNQDGQDLEALGGGFNVTLEVLRDKEKRSKIANKIREAADCIDEVVRVLQKFAQ